MQPPTLQNVRIQAAVAAIALLILAGVVWLGVAVERSRTELAAMERSMAALSLAAAGPDDAGQKEALTKLSADVAALTAKIDALAADHAKTVGRQSAELKALAVRIEAALNAAAAKAAQQAKAAPQPKSPAKHPRAEKHADERGAPRAPQGARRPARPRLKSPRDESHRQPLRRKGLWSFRRTPPPDQPR